MKHAWIKRISCFLIFAAFLWCGNVTAITAETAPANTLFDVPSFGLDFNNLLYENAENWILATSWGYGTEGNIINTIGIEESIAELNSNVSPKGKKSVLAIYVNGGMITGNAIDAIANAGWTRMSWYFYDYMVEGNPAVGMGDQYPVCKFVEDETVAQELAQRGYDGKYEVVSVSGWYAEEANVTLYTKKTVFSANTSFDVYKYDSETNSFVKLEKQGFYGDNYFGLFNILGDGIYIATKDSLSEEQMAPKDAALPSDSQDSSQDGTGGEMSTGTSEAETADNQEPDVQSPEQGQSDSTPENQNPNTDSSDNTKETLSPDPEQPDPETDPPQTDNVPVDQTQNGNDTSDSTNTKTVVSSDNKILWNFQGNADFSEFTPEATIKQTIENEVAVSFAFDGELPGEAQVTIALPTGVFSEGTLLHLFYCNPFNGNNELVDSKVCGENTVTFSMRHCSDYIITSVMKTEETANEKWLVYCGIGAVALVGIAVFVGIIRKKRS